MKFTDLTHRYLAHFVVEADTPLAIGSGQKGFTVDRLIARDALGLPYLPGSSLAGVLRHELDPAGKHEKIGQLFGYQLNSYERNAKAKRDQTPLDNTQSGQGSRLVLSSGHLIGADGKTVVEGLQLPEGNNAYYSYFTRLPERDHVRMTHRGAADTAGHGKFDEELVQKGTRFAFRFELMGNAQDADVWQHLLQLIHQPLFRIGAGTRKGFGKLKIVTCETRVFDLQVQADIQAYLDLSSSLNAKRSGWKVEETKGKVPAGWQHYQLQLKPQDFFLFAAGYGDEEVDNKPKTERYFDWKSGKPVLAEKDYVLVPATSVKGALAHRVAWQYNRLTNHYIHLPDEIAPLPSVNVEAVMAALPRPFDFETLDLPADSPEWQARKNQIEALDLDTLLEKTELWQAYAQQLAAHQQASVPQPSVGEQNPAVRALFGYATTTADNRNDGQRGRVVLEDVYLEPEKTKGKVFSHVSIDRFTGGARDGMLFQQKVVSTDKVKLDIYVGAEALQDSHVKAAWEAALQDLCNGDLPLGGSTAKGHGIFTGTFESLHQPS